MRNPDTRFSSAPARSNHALVDEAKGVQLQNDLNRLGLSQSQIATLETPEARNAVKKFTKCLKRVDFSIEQILHIVNKKKSGPMKLELLSKLCENRKTVLGTLKNEQIVSIAISGHGVDALEQLSAFYVQLKALKFNDDQLVQIAMNNGGAHGLKALVDHHAALTTDPFNLNINQIFRIVRYPGGENALSMLIGCYEQLTAKPFNFKKEHILKMVSHIGGAETLQSVINHHEQLKNLGFKSDQIAKMSRNPTTEQRLQALLNHYCVLTYRGVTHDDMVALSNIVSTAALLTALATQTWPDHMKKDEAVGLVKRRNGSENLAWFLKHHQAFENKGWQRDEILKFACRDIEVVNSEAENILGTPAQNNKRSADDVPSERKAKNKRKKLTKADVKVLEPTMLSRDSSMIKGIENIQLNTSQTPHVPTTDDDMSGIDENGKRPVGAAVRRDTENTTRSTGGQTYNPLLEKVFPIRDPANPKQVHPLYADPNDPTKVAPKVKVKGVSLYKSSNDGITERTAFDFAGKERTPYKTKELYLKALTKSIIDEMQATIDGRTPPSLASIEIKSIERREQCDGEDEYKATKGQYGAFLKYYAVKKQPSLRNAKVVCLWAGAKLESDADHEAHKKRLGVERYHWALTYYAVDRNIYGKESMITWAPYRGGNAAQFINTTFKPSDDDKNTLVCDSDATNAQLGPLMFTLTDKNGTERRESMLGVFITNAVENGKQIKLNYGPNYTMKLDADSIFGQRNFQISSEDAHQSVGTPRTSFPN